MCRLEHWSVRTLRDKINGMLYERTALSKKPEELIRQELAALTDADSLTPDMVFRDPYLLNYLELADTFSEKERSDAILREIERFLLEMGRYFTFVARKPSRANTEASASIGGDTSPLLPVNTESS